MVKIVTTNYDVLFQLACEAPYEKNLVHYFAPALPWGGDFNGIVHLHGGFAQKNNKWLVLTDEDFGKAHLTQGWAATFLRALFERYTILFVGYSLNDTVLKYLARGLTYKIMERVFILTCEQDKEHWRSFHVTPIFFPEKDYDCHNKAIEKWSQHVQSNLLEKHVRLQTIIALYNENSEIDEDTKSYMHYVMETESLRKGFLQHANSSKWYTWLSENGFLKNLFDPNAFFTKKDHELSDWFVNEYIRKNISYGISLLCKNNCKLHHKFVEHLIDGCVYLEPLPEPLFLKNLLNILLPRLPAEIPTEFEVLIGKCLNDNYKEILTSYSSPAYGRVV